MNCLINEHSKILNLRNQFKNARFIRA
uniref:Uncharacterized protein n=1 Tax=Arundo donax TaxID=35708 RepID=A0A0A9B842_ARUDO